MRFSYKKFFATFPFHIIGIGLTLIFITPLFWTFVSSLKSNADIFAHLFPFQGKTWLPFPFSAEAWGNIFTKFHIHRAIFNTFFVAIASIIGGIAINALAGYAFAAFQFKGKNTLFFIMLISFMVPFEAISIPLYALAQSMHLIDNYPGLILPSLANGMVIFLFRQFFLEIPRDFVDAARIDGASSWTIFRVIYIPLSYPAVISASLLIFLAQWESFLWPLLVIRSEKMHVIQMAIASMQMEHGTLWAELFASSILAGIIPLFCLLPLQKFYINSVVGSGIKG